jgi:hypothetical protein
MKTKLLLPILIFLFGFNQIAKADSPLTSTDLSSAYANEKIIKKAADKNGILTADLMKYLTKKSNPIAVKIAIINKLGWDIKGKNNAEIFLNYLQKKMKFKNLQDFKNRADADLLICYAYLKGLDNYFDVKESMSFAQEARKKDNKKSYTINIVCGLIEAQNGFSGDWCEVWKSTDKVRKNKSLNQDLKEDVVKNIFEYMDLYKEECK